jgi:predicted amidohydrolase YtcJ
MGKHDMRLIAVGVLALMASCSEPAPPAPDLVISNARIFTANAEQPWAEAVSVRDGSIIAVGTTADILPTAGKETRTIDAGGRLLVPGLTEAHVHLGTYGKACQPLPPVKLPYPGPTAAELLDAVKTAAAQGSGWICGTVGPVVIEDPRNWRAALDGVAPERPVVVSASWGHPTLFNTAAMRALGIDDNTPDPAGGRYDRDASGKLTGTAREAAESMIYRSLSKSLEPADNVGPAEAMANQYLKWGVTNIHLMASGPTLDQTLATLGATKTPIRWTVYAWGYPATPLDQIWSEAAAAKIPERVNLAGVKWVLDGTPIERGALMRADYADRPGWRGVSNFSDADLDAILTAALAKPQQLALHAVGDGELERLLAAMEAKAPAETWRAKRVRIEHGDGLTADLRKRAAALGLVVVQNPLHLDPSPMNPSAQSPTGTRYTPERVAQQFALKSILADGIPVALGSDAGGHGINPWLNLMLATINPINPPEALTREQALTAYTAGGAYASQQERDRGMIKPGMRADMALLSQNVFDIPPPQLPGTRSLLTVVDGAVAYEEPLPPAPGPG